MAQVKFNARLGLSVGSTPTDVLDSSGNLLITVPVSAGGTGATTAAGARTNLGAENAANKGVANGYAPLDASTKISSTYLPSYVDDVLEYANLAAITAATGETGKIYVALDTNKTYRWSGSAYVEISASPGSTDAVTEGSTNLYFTNTRARASISATQNITYNSTTGVITGPVLSGYAPLTGTGTSGSWPINITGTAGAATAASFLNSGASSTSGGDITSRITSGFFENAVPTTATGWPVSGSWYHLHTTTHSNTGNYYSMQLAADFFTQSLYYRSTNGSGTTAWNKVLHEGLSGIINIGSGQFYKDASGNVGIGTISPGSKLTVAGQIESTLTGFKFPDGTVQATAASGANWTKITTATTATTKKQYVTDTTAAAFTVTLPASPAAGDYVYFMDAGNWATNNLTVARNGTTIEASATDLVLDVKGLMVQLIYDGATWQVMSNIGPQGPIGPIGPSGLAGTPALNIVTTTTQTAVAYNQYVLTNVALSTLTLPANPTAGDIVWATPGNGLLTNILARNGKLIMGTAEDMILDNANANYQMRYINATLGWRIM